MKTANVRNPFIFRSELNVVLFSTCIYAIHFETTGNYKTVVSANVTFLQNKLLSFDIFFNHTISQFFLLLVVKWKVIVKIRYEFVYCHRIFLGLPITLVIYVIS